MIVFKAMVSALKTELYQKGRSQMAEFENESQINAAAAIPFCVAVFP